MSIQVLHITAHLGGGIGKALSGLVRQGSGATDVSHRIICLEKPEKSQFIETIEAGGTQVIVAPGQDQVHGLIEEADIVQLEWWGHPAVPPALCGKALPPMRLLLWCHVSGLGSPIIPAPLLKRAHRCIFTSPASLQTPETRSLNGAEKQRLGVIHSAGGIDELPVPERTAGAPLSAGYLGSLNFAKLHPRYPAFLGRVRIPGFRVRMIGDAINRAVLEEECRREGCPGVLDFRGYRTDIAAELSAINVMPYLLNPHHYGTTENALLEAMAMGVVPVVLNNPAESCLIRNGETGLIVSTPEEFGEAMHWLHDHPDERLRLAQNASSYVRDRFPIKAMHEAFNGVYRRLLEQDKKAVPFTEMLGAQPAQWFLNSQRNPHIFTSPMDITRPLDRFAVHGLFEKTKGSVFHFASCFPMDPTLQTWKERLAEMETSLHGNRTSS